MIRLGHIDYSNCVPVHARLLGSDAPADVLVVRGVPTDLNRALANGAIDAAPCSSIEYARHADAYHVLPFTIASRGAVQSILFETGPAPHELGNALIALPSASATSVVLLRILLRQHWGVTARFTSYDQAREDPFGNGASAALWIGDVALRRQPQPGNHVFDLGAEWQRWCGLPFAFALWQVRRDLPAASLARLAALLADSRAWFLARPQELAHTFGPTFGLEPERLLRYWNSLEYELSEDIERGLCHFLHLAAELGQAPRVAAIQKAPVPVR